MKSLVVLLFVFFLSFSMNAQGVDISTVFASMPNHYLMDIDAESKTKLLADPDSTDVKVATKIGGEYKRLALSADYLSLETSEIGSLQIKLLPLVNNTDIVAVITTVCGLACDSQIEFYTTSWLPLDKGSLFPEIQYDQFLQIENHSDPNVTDNISSILDLNPIKLSFSPSDNDIKVEYDIQKYLSSEDYKLVSPFLKKSPLILKWDKSAYK